MVGQQCSQWSPLSCFSAGTEAASGSGPFSRSCFLFDSAPAPGWGLGLNHFLSWIFCPVLESCPLGKEL